MPFPNPDEISRLMRDAEADYNLRARHPERERIYADYEARSRRLRDERGCTQLRYAQSERCSIDWFRPVVTGAPRAPLLVFFHGGFWRGGNKSTFGFIAEKFLDAGVAVALVGYELAPAVTVTEIVRQAEQAVRWLFDNAELLEFDRERVTVSGHSAGGHLSALLGSVGPESFAGATIAGVVGLSGLYALQPFLLSSVNLETRMTLDEAQALSPVNAGTFLARSLLLTVGSLETDGFIQQSRHYADCMNARHVAHDLIVCDGRTHFDIFEELVDARTCLFQQMLTRVQGGPSA